MDDLKCSEALQLAATMVRLKMGREFIELFNELIESGRDVADIRASLALGTAVAAHSRRINEYDGLKVVA